MSWKVLDIDDLRKILSEDEIQKLDTLSKDEGMTDLINDQIKLVSDTWRGAFIAKGYTYDVTDHTTPQEYHYWILVHARYAIWTRFPNSKDTALDEPREKEYQAALDLLKNPYIGTSLPEWENSSANPDNKEQQGGESGEIEPIVNNTGSIYVPYMVFPTVELWVTRKLHIKEEPTQDDN